MARATLSILGMYNYDSSIFDNFSLPVQIDKDDVVGNLLMELAELEVVYASIPFMKTAIGLWSRKELPVWEKLYESTQYEYNPIHNFDRTEEYTDSETRITTDNNTETRNLSGSNTETRNLSVSDDENRNVTSNKTHESSTTGTTLNNGKDTTTEFVAGFNSANPEIKSKTELSLATGNTVEGVVDTTDETTDIETIGRERSDIGTVQHANVDSGTVELEKTGNDIVDKSHNARMFGNIGVTTTQQMIEAERNVVKFNIIDYIINAFKLRFCILVY